MGAELVPLLRASGVEAVLEALDRGDPPSAGSELPTSCTRRSAANSSRWSCCPPRKEPNSGLPRRSSRRPSSATRARRFARCSGRTRLGRGDAFRPRAGVPGSGRGSLRTMARPSSRSRRASPRWRPCTRQRVRPRSTTKRAGSSSIHCSGSASTLWQRTAGDERAALEGRARGEPLFPVHRNDDRTIERVEARRGHRVLPPQTRAPGSAAARPALHVPHRCAGVRSTRTSGSRCSSEHMKAWTVPLRRARVPLRDRGPGRRAAGASLKPDAPNWSA